MIGSSIFAVITCFLFFAFKTPEYSVYQAAQSFTEGDLEKFEQYLDIRKVSASLSNSLIDSAIKNMETPKDEWEEAGKNLGIAMVEAYKPRIQQAIEEGFVKAINSKDDQANDFNKYFESDFAFLQGLLIRENKEFKLGKTIAKKNSAIVPFYIKEHKGNLDVVLTKFKGHWKIIEFKVSDKLFKAYSANTQELTK